MPMARYGLYMLKVPLNTKQTNIILYYVCVCDCDTGERHYMCSECGRRFMHKSSLNSHQKCFHSEETSACPECGRVVRAARMSEHLRSMHRTVLHRCACCYLEFRQQYWLDWHMMCHVGAPPYVCDFCIHSKAVSAMDRMTDCPQAAGI